MYFLKPDNELSAIETQREVTQARYTIPDKDISVDEFHFDNLRKRLTENPIFLVDTAEELVLALKR